MKWLPDFAAFLRELPRSSSCMQGTLLFLFCFFDTVTSHYYLLILLSVSQQGGLRSNPSILHLNLQWRRRTLCTCVIVAHLMIPESSLQGLSDEVRTPRCHFYFSGNACFYPGPQAQLDTGKITDLKVTWGLSGQ